MLVYDVTNGDSFKNCKYWLDNIKTYADESVVIALVGNTILVITIIGSKADVLSVNPAKRQVPRELAERFARDNNLIFIGESSSLQNQNVKEVMEALLESKPSIRIRELGIFLV